MSKDADLEASHESAMTTEQGEMLEGLDNTGTRRCEQEFLDGAAKTFVGRQCVTQTRSDATVSEGC